MSKLTIIVCICFVFLIGVDAGCSELRDEVQKFNETSISTFTKDWQAYATKFQNMFDNKECWQHFFDVCRAEWKGLNATISHIGEIKDHARLQSVLPILKEMLVTGLGMCLLPGDRSPSSYENLNEESLAGGSEKCRDLVLNYKEPFKACLDYDRQNFLKDEKLNNDLLTSARSDCFKQTPNCSEILQLSQTMYGFAGKGLDSWFGAQYIRAYGYFVRECFIKQSSHSKMDECLPFMKQLKTKLTDAIANAKDYEALAVHLRAVRTLAEEFSKCVSTTEEEFCQTVSKSLPDMITRAIFSPNTNELKRRVTTIEESVKDVFEICSRSSQFS